MGGHEWYRILFLIEHTIRNNYNQKSGLTIEEVIHVTVGMVMEGELQLARTFNFT